MWLNAQFFNLALLVGIASLAAAVWSYTRGDQSDLLNVIGYLTSGNALTAGLLGFVSIQSPRHRQALETFARAALIVTALITAIFLLRTLFNFTEVSTLLLGHITSTAILSASASRKAHDARREAVRERLSRRFGDLLRTHRDGMRARLSEWHSAAARPSRTSTPRARRSRRRRPARPDMAKAVGASSGSGRKETTSNRETVCALLKSRV